MFARRDPNWPAEEPRILDFTQSEVGAFALLLPFVNEGVVGLRPTQPPLIKV